MSERLEPGVVRDAIVQVLRESGGEMAVAQIHEGVAGRIGRDVPASSVRSYLNLNTPRLFVRTARGKYRLVSL